MPLVKYARALTTVERGAGNRKAQPPAREQLLSNGSKMQLQFGPLGSLVTVRARAFASVNDEVGRLA